MSEHELEKLLGGFAADTLTAEEKQRLYAAALYDQQLFNALADEQALRELLADPAVRRRLLQALNQTGASGAGSWLDWFRRPAGLAWAGGLAAAALAVVLGTRIYQDSLKQATPSVATEETKPAAPPTSAPPVSQQAPPRVAEPIPTAKENIAPAKDMAKKDAMLDKTAKRERAAPSASQEQNASDAVIDADNDRRQQGEARRQADAPMAGLGKVTESVSSSSDQKLAAGSAPPASAPAPAPMQAPSGTTASGALAPAVGARALYYGTPQEMREHRNVLQETARTRSQLEAASQEQSRKLEERPGFSTTRSPEREKQLLPLGLRLSFVGTGKMNESRVETTQLYQLNPFIDRVAIVESNQDGFLLVWTHDDDGAITFLYPQGRPQDSGRLSLRGRTQVRLTLPPDTSERRPRMRIYFGRVPPARFDDDSLRRMPPTPGNRYDMEYSKHSDDKSPGEEAVYYVTPDSSILLWQ